MSDILDQMEQQDAEKIALDEKNLDTEGVVQPHRSTTMPFPKVAEPSKEDRAFSAVQLDLGHYRMRTASLCVFCVLQTKDGSLKVARQNLESLVVDATRSAVKASLDAVETALQEHLSGGFCMACAFFDSAIICGLLTQCPRRPRR